MLATARPAANHQPPTLTDPTLNGWSNPATAHGSGTRSSELQTELTESELPRGVLETRRQSQMPDGDVVVASAEIGMRGRVVHLDRII